MKCLESGERNSDLSTKQFRISRLFFIFFSFLTLFLLFTPLASAKVGIQFGGSMGNNISLVSSNYGYVPYNGATNDLDLGLNDLYADWIFGFINWSDIQNVPFGNATYVPYTGATANVDLGIYDFYANATFFTRNMSISTIRDAEIRLDSGDNRDSCLVLQETDGLGFNFCYDGSGTNRWIVGNNVGDIWLEIERDSGRTYFYSDTEVRGNLIVDENLTVNENLNVNGDLNVTGTIHNSLAHAFALATEVFTIANGEQNTWLNISMNHSVPSTHVKGFIGNGDNITLTVVNDGHYTLTFGMGAQDSAANPLSNVAMRIEVNGAELAGSYVETDMTKKDADVWLEHVTHAELSAGDTIRYQYISDVHTTVTIQQEDTWATQGFSAFGYIQEIII